MKYGYVSLLDTIWAMTLTLSLMTSLLGFMILSILSYSWVCSPNPNFFSSLVLVIYLLKCFDLN